MLLVPEARGIFPGLTVEENLKVLLRDPAERKAATDRFPMLGERRDQHAGLLSGGEQQMLSLAPALARPPAVFIADEPTLGLVAAGVGRPCSTRSASCATSAARSCSSRRRPTR